MVEFDVPEVDYSRYTNRQLAAPPLAVLLLALLVIGGTWAVTGSPVDRGIDFTGGTEIQVRTPAGQDAVESTFPDASRVQPIQSQANTYVVTFQTTDSSQITSQAESAGYEVVGVQTKSASFGGAAQQQALVGVGIAFLGMSVIVFILFRTFVPSIAVVISAFSDIMIPVALMDLLGIELTLGTVAALLMLIGYSVDSDLLLNNHILRRRGGFYESAYRAMRTGVTMTLTSLAAMIVMTIVASPLVFGIPLLPDIGIVLVFGLTADLMNTYLLNMSLLRWYKYEGVAR